MRLADPKPGFCSVCYSGTDEKLRYVDFEVAYDGMPVLDPESRTIALLPWTGDQPSHDDLYICEACLQRAVEVLDLKPELDAEKDRKIERLTQELDAWRAYAKVYENAVGERPEKVDHRRLPRKQPA